MKVKFDATFEDFVDVCKRSQEISWSWASYLVLVFVVVAFSASIAGLLHWIFQNWLTTVLAALGGCAGGAYSLIKSQDKVVRDHLKRQIDQNVPILTEVEVSEIGLSTKCLGYTVVQEWSTIDQIEETNDAIYFRNKSGQYCSARKRGFASEDEMREFLRLARSFMPPLP